MALTEMGGVMGDWGDAPEWTPTTWTDADATVQPNGQQVQTNSVMGNATVSTGQDPWTGKLFALLDRGVGYAIQRDAASRGLVPATAANGQPIYAADQAAVRVGGVNIGGVLVIGAAVIAGLLLVSRAK